MHFLIIMSHTNAPYRAKENSPGNSSSSKTSETKYIVWGSLKPEAKMWLQDYFFSIIAL